MLPHHTDTTGSFPETFQELSNSGSLPGKAGGSPIHLAAARQVAVARIQIGLSTRAPEQARQAVAAGADYLGVGPVYPTGTKPFAQPVTLEYVRWAAANLRIPWFAIGGITPWTPWTMSSRQARSAFA